METFLKAAIIKAGGMKSMKTQKNNIARNLSMLRKYHKYSQEEVAEKIGVSRQAVAKWETGESVPDILNCDALADFYNVNLEDLIHHDYDENKAPIPPKGKHLFGTVKVGERGQIVLPKKAREIFDISAGDLLVVLGDESLEHPGIALMKESFFLQVAQILKTALDIDGSEKGDSKS